MRFVVVVAACGLALAGCQSKAEQTSEIAQKAEILCRSSPAGARENCRLGMMQRLLEVKTEEQAARASRIGNASALVGAALLAPQPQPRAPLACTSNTFAGMTTTNCF